MGGRETGGRFDRATLVHGGVVAAVAFLFSLTRIYDNDVWWHLATGRWMVANGRVPTTDPFSFSTAGAPWVAHSWLAELAMYGLERLGGLDGLVLGKAALVAAAFALSLRYAVRAGAPAWLATVPLLLAIPLAHGQFRERPAVAMFLLDAVFLWRLAAPRAETDRRTWLVLLPAMLLWVNVHGSFFVGVALAGCLLLERSVEAVVARSRGARGPGARSLLAAVGLVAALAALSLASPRGLALPRQMISDFTTLAVTRTFDIVEHQPLAWGAYRGFAALLAATALSFVLAGRNARVYALAVFLCVNELARRSQRFVGVAALVDASLLAMNLAPVAAAHLPRLRWWRPRLAAVLAVPALCAALVLSWRASFDDWGEARFGLGVNPARFPVAAVDFLEGIGFEGNVVNSWAFGGYLQWRLPRSPTFVDGRTLPAQLELLDRLYALDADAVERWLLSQRVRGAVLLHDDPFVQIFGTSRYFEIGFVDDKAMVYVPAGHPASSARRYRVIQLGPQDTARLAALAGSPDAAAAEAELRAAVAETQGSATQLLVLAEFLHLRGNPEAVDLYVAAAKANPRLFYAGTSWAIRAGRLALRLGRPAVAESLASRALELWAGNRELESLLAEARRAAR